MVLATIHGDRAVNLFTLCCCPRYLYRKSALSLDDSFHVRLIAMSFDDTSTSITIFIHFPEDRYTGTFVFPIANQMCLYFLLRTRYTTTTGICMDTKYFWYLVTMYHLGLHNRQTPQSVAQ